MTTSKSYRFQLPVGGADCHYCIAPIYAEDGCLRQLSILEDTPPDQPGQIININMDPDLFRQTAMPKTEVLSRIAIGQARRDKLFGAHNYEEGLLLDLAIEPWLGELTPIQ